MSVSPAARTRSRIHHNELMRRENTLSYQALQSWGSFSCPYEDGLQMAQQTIQDAGSEGAAVGENLRPVFVDPD
jgi:hypothetical protein